MPAAGARTVRASAAALAASSARSAAVAWAPAFSLAARAWSSAAVDSSVPSLAAALARLRSPAAARWSAWAEASTACAASTSWSSCGFAMVSRTSPAETCWPAVTFTSATVPSTGAVTAAEDAAASFPVPVTVSVREPLLTAVVAGTAPASPVGNSSVAESHAEAPTTAAASASDAATRAARCPRAAAPPFRIVCSMCRAFLSSRPRLTAATMGGQAETNL